MSLIISILVSVSLRSKKPASCLVREKQKESLATRHHERSSGAVGYIYSSWSLENDSYEILTLKSDTE